MICLIISLPLYSNNLKNKTQTKSQENINDSYNTKQNQIEAYIQHRNISFKVKENKTKSYKYYGILLGLAYKYFFTKENASNTGNIYTGLALTSTRYIKRYLSLRQLTYSKVGFGLLLGYSYSFNSNWSLQGNISFQHEQIFNYSYGLSLKGVYSIYKKLSLLAGGQFRKFITSNTKLQTHDISLHLGMSYNI